VAKVSPSGLSYLTYLSAAKNVDIMEPIVTPANTLYAIAVDPAGNAYLSGATSDPKFPVTAGSYDPVFPPPFLGPGVIPLVFQGFLAKLKPDGSGMVWATYLTRGSTSTFVQSIAIDSAGNTWASGITGSTIFPSTIGVSSGPEFVVGLNASGSALTYSASHPMGTVAQSISVDPPGLVHFAGVNGFVSSIAPASPPTMKISWFQNAFGGNVTARISPAEVIAIYGPAIGPSTAVTASPLGGFYPTTLGGVQVTINGIDMPLLYVSSNQINAVVPMGIPPGGTATVRVINNGIVSPAYSVWVVPSAPQAFPTVLNQDGTINSSSNPAKNGSTITFYATGWQANFSPLADGQVATTARDFCALGCQIASFSVDSPPATVSYGGVAPGIVAGVTQFNVHIEGFHAGNGALRFDFEVIGPPTSVAQSVWISP
jgi:uncharacterized protein (TIGR03437 family)